MKKMLKKTRTLVKVLHTRTNPSIKVRTLYDVYTCAVLFFYSVNLSCRSFVPFLLHICRMYRLKEVCKSPRFFFLFHHQSHATRKSMEEEK